MKKSLILLISLTVILSCANKNTVNVDPEYFIINNETLKSNVTEYYNKFVTNPNFENVITIDFSQNGDSSLFVISHDLSLFGLIHRPPLLYCKMDKINIAVRSSLNQIIEMDDIDQENKLKELFPGQFLMYKTSGTIPPPATFKSEAWVLKFIGSRFVSKEIHKY